MKPETLRALLLDRELGELAPDAVELLEAYLAAVPAAQAEAGAVARTVRTARETVRRFPELAPVAASKPVLRLFPLPFRPVLARAAAILAVAAACGWLGYRAGISTGTGSGSALAGSARIAQAAPGAANAHTGGPWTQYQVGYDPQRRAFAVEKRR